MEVLKPIGHITVQCKKTERGIEYIEINPRFGGAYLNAYGAGLDFIRFIDKNLRGEANENIIGQYEEDIVMLMYDSVVIGKQTGGGLVKVLD